MRGHVCFRRQGKGKGCWYAVLDIRDAAKGRRKQKWYRLPECNGRREAENACAKLISRRAALPSGEKVSVSEYLVHWIDHMRGNVAPLTHERYSELIQKNVIPNIGDIRLAKVRPADIDGLYNRLLREGRRDGTGGLAPRTVHHVHRLLKQAFGQAVRWEILAVNPSAAVDPPRVERKPVAAYDVSQTVNMVDLFKGTRMAVPAALAVFCGLRRGEIAALRWKNVNLETATLSVVESAEQTKAGIRYKEPKSGRTRTVALSTVVIDELKLWRAAQAREFLRLGIRHNGDSFVVTKADTSPVQPRSISHEWVRISAAKGLPRIRFHDLRHTHATHLLAAGIHPKVASERLGHSKIGITLDLYSHVMPGMQKEAADAIDDAIREARARSLANR